MTLVLPGLAADAVAELLTRNIKRPDGKDATAFNSQAAGLKALRQAVLDMDARVAELEARPSAPFPFRASS